MKFLEYISTHQVFTTASLLAAMDSPAAGEGQLRLAVQAGDVERARRGLLVSNRGRFEGASIEPGVLVSVLDAQAVVSYHSALEAHGVAHNAGFVCYFRSDTVCSGFEFRGVTYRPCGTVNGVKAKTHRSAGSVFRVTTREQTVLDCLQKPRLAGGIEEAIRSLTAFVYLDVQALVELAVQAGASAASRVGWLLDQKKNDWHVTEAHLACLEGYLGHGPYRLRAATQSSAGWSPRWRLILPETNTEVDTWITQS